MGICIIFDDISTKFTDISVTVKYFFLPRGHEFKSNSLAVTLISSYTTDLIKLQNNSRYDYYDPLLEEKSQNGFEPL